MIEFIMNNIWAIVGVAGIGGLLSLLLKKFVTDELMTSVSAKVFWVGKAAGVFVTAGLAKWKWTKSIWNSVLEPYVVILLRGIVMNLLNGFVAGLESDNKDLKDK